MSMNEKAMAGYLISRQIDKATALRLAAERAQDSWGDSFLGVFEEYRPSVGRSGAMNAAACSMLFVKGLSDYPLDRVKALLAVLAADAGSDCSMASILSHPDYFEEEPMKRLLAKPGVMDVLADQYEVSTNKRRLFKLFA